MDNTAQDFARKIVSKLEDVIHKLQSLLDLKQTQAEPRSHDDTASTDSHNSTPPTAADTSQVISAKPEKHPKSQDEKEDRRETVKYRLEIAGAAVLLIYTGFAGWQAHEMRKANSLMIEALKLNRDTLITSHRPWVFVDGDISTLLPVTFDQTRVGGSISFSIKNFGTSPAMAAAPVPTLYFGPTQYFMNRQPCSVHTKALGILTGVAGATLAPGQAIRIQKLILKGDVNANDPKFGVAVVEMCVIYRDEFNTFHLTGDYWLYVPPGTEGNEYALEGVLQGGQWGNWGVRSVAY
jgi:hypothetical protein